MWDTTVPARQPVERLWASSLLVSQMSSTALSFSSGSSSPTFQSEAGRRSVGSRGGASDMATSSKSSLRPSRATGIDRPFSASRLFGGSSERLAEKFKIYPQHIGRARGRF